MEKAKRIGIDAYICEQNERIRLLEKLLNSYDDGRRKSYYCLTVNLLDLHDIIAVMDRLADETTLDAPVKEKAASAVRLFEEMAEQWGVSLKLRKK
jgi:hypothetical protein